MALLRGCTASVMYLGRRCTFFNPFAGHPIHFGLPDNLRYALPSSPHLCINVAFVSVPSDLAKPDSISMSRSALIRMLCDSFLKHDFEADPMNAAAKKWPSDFLRACRALESYMLVRHNKIAKSLMYKFKLIDPDRKERRLHMFDDECEVEDESSEDTSHFLVEQSFMTLFTYVLRKAGYLEVPQATVAECLKKRGKYGHIQLDVMQSDYEYIRFWVYGKKEKNCKEEATKHKDQDVTVLHERVIVAARSKTDRNMILKGFKDIAVGHYEILLPEAKVLLPRGRRWFLNTVLGMSFVVSFFDIVMFLLTDLKLHRAGLMICFAGFVVYKTRALYDSQRKKYMLEWKNWLYYRSTANNAGLVMDSINQLHQRTVKEVLIVYGIGLMLSKSGMLVTEEEITNAAIQWLTLVNKTDFHDIDFCSSTAFSLLERLGIFRQEPHYDKEGGFRFKVRSPVDATEHLLAKIQATAIQ